jgi:hypothetical protein
MLAVILGFIIFTVFVACIRLWVRWLGPEPVGWIAAAIAFPIAALVAMAFWHWSTLWGMIFGAVMAWFTARITWFLLLPPDKQRNVVLTGKSEESQHNSP